MPITQELLASSKGHCAECSDYTKGDLLNHITYITKIVTSSKEIQMIHQVESPSKELSLRLELSIPTNPRRNNKVDSHMFQVCPGGYSDRWRNISRTGASKRTLESGMLDHHECQYPHPPPSSLTALVPGSRSPAQSSPPASMPLPTSCEACGCQVLPSSLRYAAHDEFRKRTSGRASGN